MDKNRNLVLRNLLFYDAIKPKNTNNHYTVLATINNYDTEELICLATGTQANLKVGDDDIQDCHAESLVKRAFKRYLIQLLRDIISHECEKSDGDLKNIIDKQVPKSVTLFISQFPCGFLSRYDGPEPVDPSTGIPIRRKPGRGTERNGKMIYVDKDNCFAKIIRWLKDGIQGVRLAQTMGVRTCIKKIIIGNCEFNENFNYLSYIRQFKSKLESHATCPEVAFVDCVRRIGLVYRPDGLAEPVSTVWWHEAGMNASTNNNCEMIVDGRKRGLTKQHYLGNSQDTYRLKIGDAITRVDIEYLVRVHATKVEGRPELD